MNADCSRESHQQRAIKFLAEESAMPMDEVAQLYDDERAAREVGARIMVLAAPARRSPRDSAAFWYAARGQVAFPIAVHRSAAVAA
ncbi:MAG: hypothetical protein LJE97_13215 [Betaproteobacteria bacterium]|jgi:hypothetical protein|nr:hypothetical protein [Betaproteobacteria bacterium]